MQVDRPQTHGICNNDAAGKVLSSAQAWRSGLYRNLIQFNSSLTEAGSILRALQRQAEGRTDLSL